MASTSLEVAAAAYRGRDRAPSSSARAAEAGTRARRTAETTATPAASGDLPGTRSAERPPSAKAGPPKARGDAAEALGAERRAGVVGLRAGREDRAHQREIGALRVARLGLVVHRGADEAPREVRPSVGHPEPARRQVQVRAERERDVEAAVDEERSAVARAELGQPPAFVEELAAERAGVAVLHRDARAGGERVGDGGEQRASRRATSR